jgi:hypothetical protein
LNVGLNSSVAALVVDVASIVQLCFCKVRVSMWVLKNTVEVKPEKWSVLSLHLIFYSLENKTPIIAKLLKNIGLSSIEFFCF